jgi:hypothetical protein
VRVHVLRQHQAPAQPAARETLPIVVRETAWAGWVSDCRRRP